MVHIPDLQFCKILWIPLDIQVYLFHLACGWIVAQKVSSKGPHGVLYYRNWPLNAQIDSMYLQILDF